jgi:hypothetical protein
MATAIRFCTAAGGPSGRLGLLRRTNRWVQNAAPALMITTTTVTLTITA